MTDTPDSGAPRRLTDEELLVAVPSGTGGREAQVGLFVLLGLISFIIVLFWMTDPATLRGRDMFVTRVDNAGGVRPGDPVQMQGVTLGRVNGFRMLGPGQIDITLEIEGEWAIPRGSTVTFGEAGLFGGRTLEILMGESSEFYVDGDTIPGIGASSGGLLGSVDELSAQAVDVLTSIQTLLSPETVEALRGTAVDARQLVAEFSSIATELRGPLGDLTESLALSAEGLEEAASVGPDIARAVARADSTMTVLMETSTNIDAAMGSLSSVLARIDAGEGTLGRLTTDDAELYENMNNATESLSALLEDLRENPNRYINISIF
ncbi:MAG: MlaD family protein [Gemmatimonadota bacterium]|nr:MlaD family protein [Gemmatimonadota bacterium]